MASRKWATGRRALLRAQLRLKRLWLSIPALRRWTPLAIALVLNVGLAAAIISVSTTRPPKGMPDAPPVVTIFVVPPSPVPEPIAQEEPEPTPEPEVMPVEVVEVVAEEPPSDEAEPASVAANAAPLPERQGGAIRMPDVEVPDTDIGQGRPDGIVALSCYDSFQDPDKAAECAGREILSGWRAEVAEIGPEWDKIADELRRGGVELPNYGPDALAGLRRNQRIFRPDDPRYLDNGFTALPRYAESFGSAKEYREFQQLRDSRRYRGQFDSVSTGYGISETSPMSGWQPSWQLRDDPILDSRDLEGLVEEE